MLVLDASRIVRRANRLIRELKVAQVHSSSHVVLLKACDEQESPDKERKLAVDALVSLPMKIVSVNMLESFWKGLAAQFVECVFESNISENINIYCL